MKEVIFILFFGLCLMAGIEIFTTLTASEANLYSVQWAATVLLMVIAGEGFLLVAVALLGSDDKTEDKDKGDK